MECNEEYLFWKLRCKLNRFLLDCNVNGRSRLSGLLVLLGLHSNWPKKGSGRIFCWVLMQHISIMSRKKDVKYKCKVSVIYWKHFSQSPVWLAACCLYNKMNLSSMLKATVVLSKLRKPLNAIVPVLATVQFTVQLKSCDVMLWLQYFSVSKCKSDLSVLTIPRYVSPLLRKKWTWKERQSQPLWIFNLCRLSDLTLSPSVTGHNLHLE